MKSTSSIQWGNCIFSKSIFYQISIQINQVPAIKPTQHFSYNEGTFFKNIWGFADLVDPQQIEGTLTNLSRVCIIWYWYSDTWTWTPWYLPTELPTLQFIHNHNSALQVKCSKWSHWKWVIILAMWLWSCVEHKLISWTSSRNTSHQQQLSTKFALLPSATYLHNSNPALFSFFHLSLSGIFPN